MTLHGVRLFGLVMLTAAGAVATSAVANAQAANAQPANAPAANAKAATAQPANAKAANAQVGAATNPLTKPAGATDAAPADDTAAPAPAPVFPKRPAELPPKPPKVTCQGNQISISADNSTLDAILAAVRGCTGAKIDIPGDSSKVRSFEELGPGPVREVLDELLSGTPYNYVIQSSEANPLKVETVLLTMRTGDTDKPGSNPNSISADIPMTPGRRAWQKMQKFDKPDPTTLNEEGTQVESDPASPASEATAVSTPQPADGNSAPAAASAAGTAATEASAAATNAAPVTPVAPPVMDPSSSSDPNQAMQDRIAAMQQMFSQRQQMIQKQNQGPGQSSTPNN